MPVKRRGFASMDPGRRHLIAGLGGNAAHANGTAHTFSHDEAVKAGHNAWLERRKNQTPIDVTSIKPQLLRLLQNSFNTDPKRPVSFSDLGRQLGLSRQYARILYYRLKKDHPVPPVNKRGVVAKNQYSCRSYVHY